MIKIILSIVLVIIATICTIVLCVLNKYKKEIWGSIELKENNYADKKNKRK